MPLLGLVDEYFALEDARQGEEELLFTNGIGAYQHECVGVVHCRREDVDHVIDHHGLRWEGVLGIAVRRV